MLEVKSLRVQYGPVTGLRDVSLVVPDGGYVAVVGPNGAGKSSLLNSIAGAVRSRSGEVLLDGKPLQRMNPEKRVRAGVSLVPEGRRIFGAMTVYENLQLGATTQRGADAEIDRMMELFPILGRFRARRAGHLSGGEQQQLAIARALLSKPRHLLLDEPSAGLAPVIVNSVFEVLDELHRSGVGILLVEQVARRAVEAADRSYVLQHGTVIVEGTSAELLAGGLLEAAYLGHRDEVEEQPEHAEGAP